MKLRIASDTTPSLEAMWFAFGAALSVIQDLSVSKGFVTTTYSYDPKGLLVGSSVTALKGFDGVPSIISLR